MILWGSGKYLGRRVKGEGLVAGCQGRGAEPQKANVWGVRSKVRVELQVVRVVGRRL